MRIAVVTCKVKPPSADQMDEEDEYMRPAPIMRAATLFSQQDDFTRELLQLCSFHGKNKQVRQHRYISKYICQDLFDIIDSLPEEAFGGRGSYHTSMTTSPMDSSSLRESPNGVQSNSYEQKFEYSNL